MKSLVLCFLLLSVNVSAMSTDSESAKRLLERFSHSIQNLNFSATFVVVKNNHVEPYHWFHGVDADGLELEVLTRLNGSRHDVLRKGGVVSYIDPEHEAYSINSDDVQGPIPSVFRGNVNTLEESYRFISIGRSRILGRVAQLIRIVPKDKFRFSYWLWLEQESALPLKMGVVTRNGQLLEQVQFTHVEVNELLPDSLTQLQLAELPPVTPSNYYPTAKQHNWQVDWLPTGFSVVNANRHQLSSYNSRNKSVEFMLFSDGLVDISVYVNASEEKFREPEYASDGATMVYNHVVQGIEVGVVGDIPLQTAKKIADSIAPRDTSKVKSTPQSAVKE